MGLVISINWDASVNNAPANFEAAVLVAVQDLESRFVNPITLTLDVGYGEINGQALGSNALGESEVSQYVSESYSAVRAALIAQAAPGSSALSATSPDSGTMFMPQGEAKALGLYPNDGSLDGFVGLSSTLPFSYADNSTPPSGEYYFIGVVEHEITEDMGRVSLLDGQPNYYAPIDLYRYTASGIHYLTTGRTGSTAYFSTDNGTTNLGTWNNRTSNGDLADWYPAGPAPGGNDAFNDYSSPGVINAFSPDDVTLMQALGYEVTPPVRSGVMTQTATGQLDFLEFSNTNLTASWLTPYQVWPIVAAGDFNAAGNQDLVTQLGGEIDFLYYNNSGQLTASSLVNGAYAPVVAAGTFTGFSGPAVVTQDPVSGEIDLLGFQGVSLTNSELLEGSYWTVVGAGNFAGNGKTELATQNTATGQIDVLLFSGTTLIGSNLLPGSYWPVKAVDDFNKDGTPDLVTQNASTGQVDHLLFANNQVVGSYMLSVAGSEMNVVNGAGSVDNFFHI